MEKSNLGNFADCANFVLFLGYAPETEAGIMAFGWAIPF